MPTSSPFIQHIASKNFILKFLLCGVITCTNIAIVDHILTDLSVAEKSSNCRIKYVVENYIQSLMLVCTRISRYSGTSYLHFNGIDEK
jgi:hypothetical protein